MFAGGAKSFFVILFNENSHGTEVTSTSIPHNVAQIMCAIHARTLCRCYVCIV